MCLVSLLLRGARHRQIDRLTLRPSGPGSTVQRRLQRRCERGRFRRDGEPRRARRRGRLSRGGSTKERSGNSYERIDAHRPQSFFFVSK